jgi:hypothetical protein
MDAYQEAMVGMTVEEVKQRWGRKSASETESTTADDAGTAQPVNDMASVPAATPEAVSGATMSLQSEYGDILLAIERAWEDARKDKSGSPDAMPLTNGPDAAATVS